MNGDPLPGRAGGGGAASVELTAVGLTVLAGLLYVIGYALSKVLVVRYGLSALQVTFLRCAVILAASVAAVSLPRGRVLGPAPDREAPGPTFPDRTFPDRTFPDLTWRRLLAPTRAWEQRAAAAALVLSNALAVLSYGLMSVTTASTLSFTAPLLLVLLGVLVLGERATPARWLGVCVGFAGMLLIVRPGGDASALGITAALGGAVLYALYQVLVRRLRGVATSLDTAMQVALVGFVGLGPAMVWFWRPLSLEAAGVMLAVTAIQTAALASIAAALRRGEAGALAPWQYSGLIWATALDALAFQALPGALTLAGGALVVGGGVLAQVAGRRSR